MENSHVIKNSILKGYLREYCVKPDLSPKLWDIAKACMENPKVFFYAIKFPDDTSMKQFAQAVLLSAGKQFNWHGTKSFSVVQDNLESRVYLADYVDFDIVFITHSRGTMQNRILGQTVNQLAVLRSPSKTFFFDRGGYPLTDLMSPLVSVYDLSSCVAKASVGKGEDL